jgi:hypothetical protein
VVNIAPADLYFFIRQPKPNQKPGRLWSDNPRLLTNALPYSTSFGTPFQPERVNTICSPFDTLGCAPSETLNRQRAFEDELNNGRDNVIQRRLNSGLPILPQQQNPPPGDRGIGSQVSRPSPRKP